MVRAEATTSPMARPDASVSFSAPGREGMGRAGNNQALPPADSLL
jgi:hypothetical protein